LRHTTEKRRAVVTGFHAAHPLLQSTPTGWTEYSAANVPDLRALFSESSEAENAEYSGTCEASWWERFFACGIIGELERTGWKREGEWQTDPQRVAVCFSSSKGRPAQLEKQREYSFDFAPQWAAVEIAKATGATGKFGCPVAACASGAHAIALAAQWIEDDLCDVAICGAVEAELAPLILAGYRSLGALSTRGVMKPFDESRDGFVPGEGGACLILESRQSAEKRGAKVWAQVSGWSLFCDATSQTGMMASGETISRAIENALHRANVESVDYVNAHGTATHLNDEIEARAIGNSLGSAVPVSSTKALTGHLLGAAGAVEAVLSILAMQQSFAPPNLNLETIDPSCEKIDLLKDGREAEINSALSLSYGFGGHIGVLLLGNEEAEGLNK
jgi:3-oxoacyl-(acyl-carrier-protein) synthase